MITTKGWQSRKFTLGLKNNFHETYLKLGRKFSYQKSCNVICGMKLLTFIILLFLANQIVGCEKTLIKRSYKGVVYAVDTFENSKSIYIMPVGSFIFVDETGKYNNGDTAIIEQVVQHNVSGVCAKTIK